MGAGTKHCLWLWLPVWVRKDFFQIMWETHQHGPTVGKSYAWEQENLNFNTEIIRRIVNISGDPEDSIRLEIMDEYAIKVRHSDHSLEQTRTIIKYYIEWDCKKIPEIISQGKLILEEGKLCRCFKLMVHLISRGEAIVFPAIT